MAVTQNKMLDDNKEPTDDQIRDFARMTRLKMDINPEFAEHFKKLLNETRGVPVELKKKFSAI